MRFLAAGSDHGEDPSGEPQRQCAQLSVAGRRYGTAEGGALLLPAVALHVLSEIEAGRRRSAARLYRAPVRGGDQAGGRPPLRAAGKDHAVPRRRPAGGRRGLDGTERAALCRKRRGLRQRHPSPAVPVRQRYRRSDSPDRRDLSGTQRLCRAQGRRHDRLHGHGHRLHGSAEAGHFRL